MNKEEADAISNPDLVGRLYSVFGKNEYLLFRPDDEFFELGKRFPDDVACTANAHALEENMQNPPLSKVDNNLRKPSKYRKSNIYVDSMVPNAIGLKAIIEMCGVDRVLFGPAALLKVAH